MTSILLLLIGAACGAAADESDLSGVDDTPSTEMETTTSVEVAAERTMTDEPEVEEADGEEDSEEADGEVAAEPNSDFKQTQLDLGWTDGVRCRIDGGDTYDGPCLFVRENGGSFSIQSENGEPIGGALIISVSIVEEGEAEVRGLTPDGINSRWGAATRSEEEPACWTGVDFEICAF